MDLAGATARVSGGVDILYWTVGRGTGHVKRANALRRGFALAGREVRLWACVPESVFTRFLDPRIHIWSGESRPVDICILDHRLDAFPPRYAAIAPAYLHLCRIGTSLEIPASLAGRVTRISIEDGAANRRLALPYDGCLIDAAEEEVLEPEVARAALEQIVGRPLRGSLGLSQVNTAAPHAAAAFLAGAAARLAAEVDTVVVSCAHEDVHSELTQLGRREYGERLVVARQDPLHPFYRAFDAGIFPCSYNTYCETRLFFTGRFTCEPVVFTDDRPRFVDQCLRAAESPRVGNIGNERIARRVLEFLAS